VGHGPVKDARPVPSVLELSLAGERGRWVVPIAGVATAGGLIEMKRE